MRSVNPPPRRRIGLGMLMQTMPTPSAAESESAPFDAGEDAILVRRAACADMPAFEALYRRHHRRVHGVIVRLVGQAGARAEDLTQEAFVRAWQALPSFRFESAVSTWLHRLAVNVALMDLRARRTRPWHEDDDAELETVATVDGAGRLQLSLDLAAAVATLPPRARAAAVWPPLRRGPARAASALPHRRWRPSRARHRRLRARAAYAAHAGPSAPR